MLAGMVVIALGAGYWFAANNPGGMQLHAPVAEGSAEPEVRNAFAFGASIGLLASCLIYSVVLFASMIRAGTRQQRPGTWCYLLAVIIALGFVASYLLDTQFV